MQPSFSVVQSALAGMGVGAIYFGIALWRAAWRPVSPDPAAVPRALLMFLGVGAIAGVFIGLVRALATGLRGMMAAAAVLLSPVGFYAAHKQFGSMAGWTLEAWAIAALITAMLGFLAGGMVWHLTQQSSDDVLS